jgi:hypothetical protein
VQHRDGSLQLRLYVLAARVGELNAADLASLFFVVRVCTTRYEQEDKCESKTDSACIHLEPLPVMEPRSLATWRDRAKSLRPRQSGVNGAMSRLDVERKTAALIRASGIIPMILAQSLKRP